MALPEEPGYTYPCSSDRQALTPALQTQEYTNQIFVDGGTPPYTYILIGDLPDGFTLNSSTGEISGTSEEVGVYDFSIQIIDSKKCRATQQFSITVVSVPG